MDIEDSDLISFVWFGGRKTFAYKTGEAESKRIRIYINPHPYPHPHPHTAEQHLSCF